MLATYQILKVLMIYGTKNLVSHTFFMRYPDANANPAHLAIAKLEEIGKLKAVVTQNIDGLHQAAGSKVVYELHGSVLRNYCMKCGALY